MGYADNAGASGSFEDFERACAHFLARSRSAAGAPDFVCVNLPTDERFEISAVGGARKLESPERIETPELDSSVTRLEMINRNRELSDAVKAEAERIRRGEE